MLNVRSRPLAGVLLLFAAAGCREDAPSPADVAALARGREVYTANCVACHGHSGEGNGPAAQVTNPKPRNFVEGKFKYGDRPEDLFKTVTNGVEGTAMPSWKSLPEEDRRAVIRYVRSFKK